MRAGSVRKNEIHEMKINGYTSTGDGIGQYDCNIDLWQIPDGKRGLELNLETADFGNLPRGTLIPITIKVPHGAETVKLYDVTVSDTEELIAEISDMSDATAYVPNGAYDKKIIAKAFDDSGAIVGTSTNVVTIKKGYEYLASSNIYDFDFEDTVVTEPNDGKWVYVGGEDSNFIGNTGNDANAIVTDETVSEVITDNTYGKALHIDANGVGQVQLNQIKVNYSGSDVVRFDFDFYTNFYSDSFHAFTSYATSSAGNTVNTSLIFDRGVFNFNGKTISVGSDAKWAHLTYLYDFGADKVVFIVNGKVVDVADVGTDITRLDRMYLALSSGHTGDVWLDNFKVDVPSASYICGLADTEYYVDGEVVTALTAGTLTVKTAVAADGETVPLTLIAATYDGSKLVNVSYNPVSFAEGETVKLFTMNMGEVKDGMTAKVMLWKESCIPYQISAIGKK